MSKRSVGAKWLKWAIILMFLIAVAPVCLAYVLVETEWGRARMRDMAVEAIRDELGLRAELGRVEVEAQAVPPGLAVSAKDIVLDDPVYGRFAEADGLTIRPSLGALLRGQVDLREVVVDSPTLNLVVREGEIRNLPRVEGGDSGEADLPFDEILVRNATVGVDADPFATVSLEGVDLTLRAEDDDRLRLVADSTRGTIDHTEGTEKVQRLLIDAGVTFGERADVDHFVFRTPHLRAELRDATVPLPDPEGWSGEVDVKVHLTHLRSLPVAWEMPTLDGWARAEGHVQDADGGPEGEGTLTLTDVYIDHDWGLGELVELDVRFDPEAVHIDEGRAVLVQDGGEVGLTGTVGLEGELPIDIRGDIRGLEFDRLMAQLGVSPDAIVSWHFDGGFHLTGTLDPLDFDGPLKVSTRDFLVSSGAWHEQPRDRIVGVSKAKLRSRVVVDSGALRFENIVADTPRSTLKGDVSLGFDNRLYVGVTAETLDIEDCAPIADIPMGGKGTAQVEIEGPFSDPKLTGHLDLDGFSFNDYPFGDVSSDAQLEKGGIAVRFPSVTVQKRDSLYRVDDLFLDFSRDRMEVTGMVHARRLQLADVYHIFNYEGDERFESYQGTLRGLVGVRYTLGFPTDGPSGTMVLDLDLDLPAVELSGYHFEDGHLTGQWRWLDLDAGVAGAELDLEHVELHKGDGTVTAQGRMDLGAKLHLSASADELSIQQTEGLGESVPDLRGTYGLTAEIRGTADVPRAHVDINLTGLTYDGELLGDARTYVRLTDVTDPWVQQAAEWDAGDPPQDEPCANARMGLAQGRWAPDPPLQTVEGPVPALDRRMAYLVCGQGLDGQVQLDLALGRTEPIPLRGIVDIEGLDLAPFLPEQQDEETSYGTTTGRIRLTGGSMKRPGTLVARVDLEELRLGTESVEMKNDGPIVVEAERGQVTVERARFEGPASELRVSGGASFDRGLALQLDGSMDLGLLSTLSPRVRHAQGLISMRVNLSGPFEQPSIFGEARVEDAGFLFASFDEPITDLEGRMSFSAHKVLFDEFQANVAGGTIAMQGAATLQGQGLESYHFDVTAKGLSLRPDEGIDLGFGGQVRLEWSEGERLPVATGVLRLDRLRYTRDIQVSPTLGELYQPRRAEVDRYDPDEDLLSLDIRVVDEGPLEVENNLVDAEVRIDDSEREFRVVGTDQRFGVVGKVVVPRGTVRFRGREFEITRGVIEFDDTFRVDPQFDIQAVTEIRRRGELTGPDWRITLHAHGNRDAFRLDASSEPEVSEEDVMLLLTVGMTRAEAEQMQAGDLSATALDALSQVTGVDREVQSRVPVDDFAITSQYSPRTNRTEPHVSVGKRIAERVRLSASTALSETRDFRTGLEWELSDETSVQAVYDNENAEGASSFGNVGVDVRWRLEFE